MGTATCHSSHGKIITDLDRGNFKNVNTVRAHEMLQLSATCQCGIYRRVRMGHTIDQAASGQLRVVPRASGGSAGWCAAPRPRRAPRCTRRAEPRARPPPAGAPSPRRPASSPAATRQESAGMLSKPCFPASAEGRVPRNCRSTGCHYLRPAFVKVLHEHSF